MRRVLCVVALVLPGLALAQDTDGGLILDIDDNCPGMSDPDQTDDGLKIALEVGKRAGVGKRPPYGFPRNNRFG